jgi:hypothetical protein
LIFSSLLLLSIRTHKKKEKKEKKNAWFEKKP